MTPKEITYASFYLLAFGLAIWIGLSMGFTDTHTLPVPFLIEFIALLVGGILLFVDVLIEAFQRRFQTLKCISLD